MRPSTDALEKAGVTVREAGPDDAVGGVAPSRVVLPETVEELSAVLRACAEQDLAVVPVGGGTRLHWGAPPERCEVLLDLCCMNEILEHAAGDLVVRAQAGVTMGALADELARQGQELALDVHPESTVGGTLATGAFGPRAFRYGTPRDLLIGVTVVLADGTVARSGGKVVKNVAGYDLGKLFTGSYGTLGVIAEATFRLHPLPAARRWLVMDLLPPSHDVAAGPSQPHLVAAALAASQAEPSAVEIDWPHAGGPVTLAALVEGAAADQRAHALRESARAVSATVSGEVTGEVTAEPPPWWAAHPAHDEVLVEARFRPSDLDGVLRAAREHGFRLRGSPVSGRLLLAPVGEVTEERLAAALGELRARARSVVAPAAPYEGLDRWGRVPALALMRRVKERFDPGRRMSPGRFAGGI
jgi:glycolate oxidase FAD binding subunit